MKTITILLLTLSLQSHALQIYQQDCHIIGEDDFVRSSIEIQSPLQSGSSFILKLTAYEDDNCEIPYLQYNQYFHVMQISDQNLNLETEKITYTSLSHEVTDALNLIHYCNVENWIVHNEESVTGRVCDDYLQLSAKQILFQILKLNSDGRLYLGNMSHTLDGRSEKQRPIDFDPAGFTLQP